MDIIIWDNDGRRIRRIEKNLREAMRVKNTAAYITIMSELPMISRKGIMNKIPVLEAKNMYWSLKPGEDISFEQCLELLDMLAKV